MTNPKNQKMEVLNLLLSGEKTTLEIINVGVLNPSSKISQLRQLGVNILCENQKHKNKFGRNINYGRFSILNRNESKKIYNTLNK
jgi:hypothetical protein